MRILLVLSFLFFAGCGTNQYWVGKTNADLQRQVDDLRIEMDQHTATIEQLKSLAHEAAKKP